LFAPGGYVSHRLHARADVFRRQPRSANDDEASPREGKFMSMNDGGEAAGLDQPQISVVAQYIKDLSFENPNAPRSLMASDRQPQIGIQINVEGKPLSDTDFEVDLRIEAKAELNGELMFNFELDFAGLFRFGNIPPESMNAVVLIECPRLLFPFAREIVASTVRSGGYPPLLLEPVDFAALYRQRMSQMPPGDMPVA
jgi:preprotein translocase subunit SecB